MKSLSAPNVVALVLLALVAVLAPWLLGGNETWLRVITLCCMFAAMGQAWNILGGLASQISLGHAAFFGVGAYSSTLLLMHFQISPWLGMFVGMALAVVLALVLSIPTFRLRGHYFALATLAAGEVMRLIAISWSDLTGGPVGISVPYLPEGSFAMFQFASQVTYYFVGLGLAVLVSLVFWYMKTSAIGYRLRAVKENQEAAEVVGVNTYRTKLIASMVSAALTALCGTFYAQFNYFFDPDAVFSIASVSIQIALITILGGIGTLIGPILGALFIVPLEETINAQLGGEAAGLSAFVYGVILIAIILFRPHGLASLWDEVVALFTRGSNKGGR
ncbi:branched-chain amino acid ABC transporter permease [Fodinicurvata sediminis]|uniref:branched-chain amino acid ABC transporter permease n=1 Tax=Fodinicurvata sediminis TaxID=1121832 RepID=UPI0003FE6817|nr:branched-chain amino acid ABC transporter permease [Fodinicurvata sediminis]